MPWHGTVQCQAVVILLVDRWELALLIRLPNLRGKQLHNVVGFRRGQDVYGALVLQFVKHLADAVVQSKQVTECCFGLPAFFEFGEWICLSLAQRFDDLPVILRGAAEWVL